MITVDSVLLEGYRMTEIGPLPEEWQVVKLGEVIDVIRNGLTKRQNKEGKGLPVTRIETIAEEIIDVSRVGFVEGITDKEFLKYRLAPGDILFSHINSEQQIGKSAIYEGHPPVLLHGMNLLLIRTKQSICNPHFLNYLFHEYRRKGLFVSLAARAVGQASINQGKMKLLPIPLPPLPEQRTIAHVLRVVQEAKEATERVIAAARELKKSLMRHLFTYGPVPVDQTDRVPMQETEIGPLPAHWRVARLGEIAEVRGGYAFPHRLQGKRFGKFPFFKVSDMNLPENVQWMRCAQNYIEEEDLRMLRARPFPEDTIIFPKIGGAIFTNKKRILSKPSLIDNNVLGVIVKEPSYNVLFLFYYFQSIDLARFARIGPLPSITGQRVKEEIIPLPPLPEQREIARVLQAVDEKIRAEEGRKQALEALFKTLLHDLMAAKRRLPTGYVQSFQGGA